MLNVVDVRPTVVTVPYTDPETWFFGRTWGLTNIILEIETDDGVVGIGELPGLPSADAALQAVGAMTQLLLGHSAKDITPFLRRVQQYGWHHFPYQGNAVVAGFEMALWDIVGKAAGLPVNAFFGGVESATVPYYWYVWVTDRDVASATQQAVQGVELGFRTVYLKIGFDLANDLALVRAVREVVGPDIAIRVDANEAWTPFVARRALEEFEDVGLEFLEQPTDMHDLAALAELRAQTRTRIGANQSAWQVHQIPKLLAARAADVIVTDPHQLGGLSVFRDVAAMCEVAHVPLVKHSFGDLGVTSAATLHVLGGLPQPSLGHQTHLTILEHDLLSEPLEFVDGCLAVPERPGLGVELDRDAVAHYAQVYAAVGDLPAYANVDAPSTIPADLRRPATTVRADWPPRAASALAPSGAAS